MLDRIRTHVGSNVVGYVGIFIALGGTSYAAATGSIGSREIKNNSIVSKDIRSGGVASSDVRNGSLEVADLKPGALAKNVTLRVRSGVGTGVTASCNPGEKAVGGGADGDLGPFTAYPEGANGATPVAWTGKSESANAAGDDVTVFVVCLSP
jgi:hypothetical protein